MTQSSALTHECKMQDVTAQKDTQILVSEERHRSLEEPCVYCCALWKW